ncbi:putative capsular polysaccharide synthesis family protein, partial [Microcystis aeruginosa]|uniref:putative capsular polysaccharide synthesis family protein n=1 Tax=Microcystis aeruginosa TaxID=1126 RepID=UPI0005C6C377
SRRAEFKLVRTNVGEDKNYRDMYKEFKQNLKLPLSYVEEMCSSKYFNHFYTEEEIRKVYSRWT